MPHEPKLTVYTIRIKPIKASIEDSNRWLFRNIIGEANDTELEDSFILTELFRKFIHALDTPAMYSDPKSRKCMTANQPDIEDSNVNPNIILHSQQSIIEGKIEGGSYGRKRNKTSTVDKSIKSNVDERDAITDDFYFLLYLPLESNKIVLFLQSYSDDSIDSVMKKFWENFFSYDTQFFKPAIRRFVPQAIIDDFKRNATVSSLTFSTEIPGETLLESTRTQTERHFKVTIQVTPTNENFSMDEFEEAIIPIQQTYFTRLLKLGQFSKKKGILKDNLTSKTSPFELGSSFEIQPSILLSKYININEDKTDFDRIKSYCFTLLEDVKSQIYLTNAIQER